MMQPQESAKQTIPLDGVFSSKLYADTLRRLRLTGLLLTLACLLVTLSGLLPRLYDKDMAPVEMAMNLNFFGNGPVFFALLAPALLMMQTFFFLYRRNGSDLYHSLPYTRRTLGVSLIAASLTWSFAVVAAPLAVCAVLIPFAPCYFPMALLGWMLAHHLTTIVLITGCAFIGVSLSGTPLTGVLIAGLALFLPRWAMTVYRYFVVNVSGMMIYNDAGRLLSPALHLPTADLVLLTRGQDLPRFLGMTYARFFHNVPGILYTLALGAAALAFGLRRFIRRKSELAGHSLARPWERNALHAAIALTGLLWASYSIYQGYKGYRGNWLTAPALIWAAVAVVACFALYLAYQWLRTKVWRGAVYAAPFMVAAVACAVAVCWGGTASGLQTRAGMPEAARVASVRFPCEPGDYGAFFGYRTANVQWDLPASQAGGLRYDDPEMLGLAAAAIRDSAMMLEEYAAGRMEYLYGGMQVTMEMTLTDGQSLRRTVGLAADQAVDLNQRLLASPDFMRAIRQMPETPYLAMHAMGRYSLPDDDGTRAIWQTFRDELDALSDLDFVRQTPVRYSLPDRLRGDDESYREFPTSMWVYGWRGADLCSVWFGVGPKTPLTLDACVREGNRRLGDEYKRAQEAAGTLDFLGEFVYYSLEFTYSVERNGRTLWRRGYLIPLSRWSDRYWDKNALEDPPDREEYEAARADETEKIRNILLNAPLAEDGGEPIVRVSLGATIYQDDGTRVDAASGSAFIRVSEADFAVLAEIAQRRELEGMQ